MRSDPANEEFARSFTEHYDEIAEKYPVYKELFEYAKLVSLAKYLKEKGVPMLWFLLANKDMVITEDSPGTVDALAKSSEYFEYVHIEGGVDLAIRPSDVNYVIDKEAARAINRALELYGPGQAGESSILPSKTITIDTGDEDYTIMPSQTIVMSGGRSKGDRYQTDLAVRSDKDPVIELIRYYDAEYEGPPTFGREWHLMIPYKVRPHGGERIRFLNAMIPQKMVVKNLITGREELLTFSTDRYSIAGYVPDKLETSQVVGLFLMSDASYRLADKLGNEFWFDQAGNLTDMVFSKDHHYHIEYLYGFTDAFEEPPYRLKSAGGGRIRFRGVTLPERIKVVNLATGKGEALVFSDKGRIVGYLPEDKDASRFQILALMSDLSYQLLDKEGYEITFDPDGRFEAMAPPSKHPMVKSISQGANRVDFKYTIDKSGGIMIASASLSEGEEDARPTYTVKYEYDDERRLYKVERPLKRFAYSHQPDGEMVGHGNR